MSEAAVAQLVEFVLGGATVLALLRLSIPRARPWTVVVRCVRDTATSQRRLLYLGACCSILVFNYLYLALGVDDYFTQRVEPWPGVGFTPLIHRHIEGDAVARVQGAVAWMPLTCFFGYVYVVVFPCLVFLSILVFDHWRDRRHLAMLLLGYGLNFLICLPFYLLFPVLECFVFYARRPHVVPAARLLLDDISPAVMAGYRSMSGVDNCFPSFHTSLAVTVALVAGHAGRARFSRAIGFCSGAIVLSTLYLGIHWLTDVAAGLLVGWVAYRASRAWSRRWGNMEPES